MALEDFEAERAILGATILAGGRESSLLGLDGSDFYDPRNQVLASVLRDMIRQDIPVDMLTVTRELEARGKLSTPGGVGGTLYVHDLAGPGVFPVSAPYYAAKVREATRLRDLHNAARRAMQMCLAEDSGEYLQDTVKALRIAVDELPGPFGTDDTNDGKDTVGAMLSETDQETDWLIPGHIAREDRAVIVAAEGVAKTTLCRQLAVCYAGGLNPWTGDRVADGLRVLYVDAENSRAQSRRAYRWIADMVDRPLIAPGWKDRIVHKTRNDGVDLVNRDEKWFRDLADRVSPDVIILGPAYKLFRGDPTDEGTVANLLDVVDKVRVQHNAAVVIEAHAPHGSQHGRAMRPFGPSIWLRWPEIILGYQRDSTILPEFQPAKPEYLESVDARGRREERDWPDRIRWGAKGTRDLPWMPTNEYWRPTVTAEYQIPEGELA